MTTTKKYSDAQWEFIRDFELADSAFAEFMTRYKEHRAKQFQPNCAMSHDDIRRMEKDMADGRPLSADDAWEIINLNHEVEHHELLHTDGLRARSEAAWRARPLHRIKDACRSLLRELRLPA